jgi:hypothetical protein
MDAIFAITIFQKRFLADLAEVRYNNLFKTSDTSNTMITEEKQLPR